MSSVKHYLVLQDCTGDVKYFVCPDEVGNAECYQYYLQHGGELLSSPPNGIPIECPIITTTTFKPPCPFSFTVTKIQNRLKVDVKYSSGDLLFELYKDNVKYKTHLLVNNTLIPGETISYSFIDLPSGNYTVRVYDNLYDCGYFSQNYLITNDCVQTSCDLTWVQEDVEWDETADSYPYWEFTRDLISTRPHGVRDYTYTAGLVGDVYEWSVSFDGRTYIELGSSADLVVNTQSGVFKNKYLFLLKGKRSTGYLEKRIKVNPRAPISAPIEEEDFIFNIFETNPYPYRYKIESNCKLLSTEFSFLDGADGVEVGEGTVSVKGCKGKVKVVAQTLCCGECESEITFAGKCDEPVDCVDDSDVTLEVFATSFPNRYIVFANIEEVYTTCASLWSGDNITIVSGQGELFTEIIVTASTTLSFFTCTACKEHLVTYTFVFNTTSTTSTTTTTTTSTTTTSTTTSTTTNTSSTTSTTSTTTTSTSTRVPIDFSLKFDCLGIGGTVTVIDVLNAVGVVTYKLDSGDFQISNVFLNVTPGVHIVTVKDSLRETSKPVTVYECTTSTTSTSTSTTTSTTTTTTSACNYCHLDFTTSTVCRPLWVEVTINITGGSGSYTLIIDSGAQTIQIFGNSYTITTLNIGTHTFELQDPLGINLTKSVVVTGCTTSTTTSTTTTTTTSTTTTTTNTSSTTTNTSSTTSTTTTTSSTTTVRKIDFFLQQDCVDCDNPSGAVIAYGVTGNVSPVLFKAADREWSGNPLFKFIPNGTYLYCVQEIATGLIRCKPFTLNCDPQIAFNCISSTSTTTTEAPPFCEDILFDVELICEPTLIRYRYYNVRYAVTKPHLTDAVFNFKNIQTGVYTSSLGWYQIPLSYVGSLQTFTVRDVINVCESSITKTITCTTSTSTTTPKVEFSCDESFNSPYSFEYVGVDRTIYYRFDAGLNPASIIIKVNSLAVYNSGCVSGQKTGGFAVKNGDIVEILNGSCIGAWGLSLSCVPFLVTNPCLKLVVETVCESGQSRIYVTVQANVGIQVFLKLNPSGNTGFFSLFTNVRTLIPVETFGYQPGGTYLILVEHREANLQNDQNCIGLPFSPVSTYVTVPVCVTTSSSTTTPSIMTLSLVGSCSGIVGFIQATVSGGVAPYEYKLDSGVYQSLDSFTTVSGVHIVCVRDATGKEICESVTVVCNTTPTVTPLVGLLNVDLINHSSTDNYATDAQIFHNIEFYLEQESVTVSVPGNGDKISINGATAGTTRLTQGSVIPSVYSAAGYKVSKISRPHTAYHGAGAPTAFSRFGLNLGRIRTFNNGNFTLKWKVYGKVLDTCKDKWFQVRLNTFKNSLMASRICCDVDCGCTIVPNGTTVSTSCLGVDCNGMDWDRSPQVANAAKNYPSVDGGLTLSGFYYANSTSFTLLGTIIYSFFGSGDSFIFQPESSSLSNVYLCSSSSTTSTSTTTTTSTTSTTTTVCPNCPPVYDCNSEDVDFIFVIDRSGSVNATELQYEKTFFNSILDGLSGINSGRIRTGVVTFGATAELVQSIGNPTTLAATKGAINSISLCQSCGTNIHAGLTLASTAIQSGRGGARKLIIIATDGTQNIYVNGVIPHSLITQLVDNLRGENVDVILVGYGDPSDFSQTPRELSPETIALWNSYVGASNVLYAEWSQLSTLVDSVRNRICVPSVCSINIAGVNVTYTNNPLPHAEVRLNVTGSNSSVYIEVKDSSGRFVYNEYLTKTDPFFLYRGDTYSLKVKRDNLTPECSDSEIVLINNIASPPDVCGISVTSVTSAVNLGFKIITVTIVNPNKFLVYSLYGSNLFNAITTVDIGYEVQFSIFVPSEGDYLLNIFDKNNPNCNYYYPISFVTPVNQTQPLVLLESFKGHHYITDHPQFAKIATGQPLGFSDIEDFYLLGYYEEAPLVTFLKDGVPMVLPSCGTRAYPLTVYRTSDYVLYGEEIAIPTLIGTAEVPDTIITEYGGNVYTIDVIDIGGQIRIKKFWISPGLKCVVNSWGEISGVGSTVNPPFVPTVEYSYNDGVVTFDLEFEANDWNSFITTAKFSVYKNIYFGRIYSNNYTIYPKCKLGEDDFIDKNLSSYFVDGVVTIPVTVGSFTADELILGIVINWNGYITILNLNFFRIGDSLTVPKLNLFR